MEKVVDELLEAGLVSISDSPHSSPFFMVLKPDGKFRPVADYKEVNKYTIREEWPIPKIVDIYQKMSKARFRSKMDAKGGFFQVPFEKKSQKLSAISTGTRKVHWNFMPM